MKNSVHWRVLRPIILLVWAVFALILTTQTDQIPVVALMASMIATRDNTTLGKLA